MPKLTEEQEKFLKDLETEIPVEFQKAETMSIRRKIKAGELKYAELEKRQLEMLDKYPEERQPDK